MLGSEDTQVLTLLSWTTFNRSSLHILIRKMGLVGPEKWLCGQVKSVCL